MTSRLGSTDAARGAVRRARGAPLRIMYNKTQNAGGQRGLHARVRRAAALLHPPLDVVWALARVVLLHEALDHLREGRGVSD